MLSSSYIHNLIIYFWFKSNQYSIWAKLQNWTVPPKISCLVLVSIIFMWSSLKFIVNAWFPSKIHFLVTFKVQTESNQYRNKVRGTKLPTRVFLSLVLVSFRFGRCHKPNLGSFWYNNFRTFIAILKTVWNVPLSHPVNSVNLDFF